MTGLSGLVKQVGDEEPAKRNPVITMTGLSNTAELWLNVVRQDFKCQHSDVIDFVDFIRFAVNQLFEV